MEINPLFYYQEQLWSFACEWNHRFVFLDYYKYYQKMQNSFLKMVSINVGEININIKWMCISCKQNILLFVSNSTYFFDQYLHSETENYLASKSSFHTSEIESWKCCCFSFLSCRVTHLCICPHTILECVSLTLGQTADLPFFLLPLHVSVCVSFSSNIFGALTELLVYLM